MAAPERLRLRPEQRVLLFRQMRLLLSAGVLLADALRALRDRFPDRRVRRLIARVHAEVTQSRRTFSAALAQFPRSFPASDIAIIAAGESGGSAQLAERLGDLAERIDYESRHRRDVRHACAYPSVVAVLALGLLAFLLTIVVPRLEELLHSLGGKLPPLMRAVMATAETARRSLPQALAVAGVLAALAWLLRRSRWFARCTDRLILRAPLAGSLYRDFWTALFCKIYRSLYLSNQPAPAILDACVLLTRNEAVRVSLRSARNQIVRQGAQLSAALERTRLFPPLAILALEVGEQSGQLAEALDQVSRHFHSQARERVQTAIHWLNPVLTVALVGGVGTIMIAFFQSIYQVIYASS